MKKLRGLEFDNNSVDELFRGRLRIPYNKNSSQKRPYGEVGSHAAWPGGDSG